MNYFFKYLMYIINAHFAFRSLKSFKYEKKIIYQAI